MAAQILPHRAGIRVNLPPDPGYARFQAGQRAWDETT